MSETKLQQLLDWKEILELKARYFRSFDDGDWDGFRAVFADDCTFDIAGQRHISSADAFLKFVRTQVVRSVHRGTLPEITLEGPTTAHGIWQLNEYVEWDPDPGTGERAGYTGFGRHIEEYRKIDGDWKIVSWRLVYLRVDPLPREPLPEAIIGGPDAMGDDE